MDKVTIAFVQPSLPVGGSEKILCDLIRGLDKDKFRPVVCCLYGPGPLGAQLEAEGYRVYHDLIRTKYDPRSIAKVASILVRERPHILYVTNALLNVFVGRLAAFLARVPRCVIIFHSYDALLETYRPRSIKAKLWLTEKMLLSRFDRVIAIAETQKTYLMSSKHIPGQKIAVVYNGIDLRQFAHPVDARAVRRRLQIPDEAKVVGIVGCLFPWKAHDVFLQAAAVLLKEAPETYFVVAGDGPERNKLEQMARTLDVADHVRFLGNVDDVPTLLKAVDLSVLTSDTEAFPLVLLESMAARRPVVATNVGSVPEIVIDGLTGFLVPPGAPEQFAQVMLQVLRDPELARKLGEAGRKRVEQKFTVERMISQTESLLLELVDSTGHSTLTPSPNPLPLSAPPSIPPLAGGRGLQDREVVLRRFPYPFRAALAICSDIDETRTVEEFLEIQRFLNTKDITSMGEGVGLEIGNSFFFYDTANQFSYFCNDESARRVIISLIRAGYIDCLHTYGDGAASRDEILRALDVLDRNDCKLDVWVNHHGAPSNLSRKFEYMFGECGGDDPGSHVYHADVTLAYGIRFIWVGATTRVIGQSPANSSSSLSTVFDPRYPLHSGVNIAMEIRKRALGAWGDERFVMHRLNHLTRTTQLGDGQRAHEFMRYCNHPTNISKGATSRGLSYAISRRALEWLKARQGFMIVYTHLGKNGDCQQMIAPETQAALRHLEREYRDGEIYVTTTSRLLNHYHARNHLVWSYRQNDGRIQIMIDRLDDPVFGQVHPTVQQLQGLTFYVPASDRVDVYVGGSAVQGLQRNAADESGMESVTLPFTRLVFPL